MYTHDRIAGCGLLRLFLVTGMLTLAFTAQAQSPAKPTIAWMPDGVPFNDGQGAVNLSWNLWWGTNGDHWKLRRNGTVVHSAPLTPSSPNAQSGERRDVVTQAGVHNYVVDLCLGNGASEVCTSSDPKAVSVGGGGGPDGLTWPAPLAEHNRAYVNHDNKVVGAYFVEWGVYDRAFPVRRIPSPNLTHLLYAFIAICGPNDSLRDAYPPGYQVLMNACANKPDYSVTIYDRYAALDMPYPGDSSSTSIKGNFGQLIRLKAAQPNLKILPSIGGWTLSDPFFHLASDPTRRATFITSTIQFLRAYPFFDGVDLDWEYPGGDGANPTLGSPADRAGHVALITEMRAALDALGVENNRHYLLTSAVGAAPAKIAAVDYATIGQKLDLLFAMTYDFYGAWSGALGHHSGLYPVPNAPTPGFSANAAVDNLLAAGVPANKLALGVAMYGRGWNGVTGAQAGQPFTGVGAAAFAPGTWEDGVLDYRDIETRLVGGENGAGTNGFVAGYDDLAQAPWVWNASTGQLVSYENARSARAKGQYVQSRQLAGVFSWEIDADNGRILNAIHEGLGHSPAGSDRIFANGFQGATP